MESVAVVSIATILGAPILSNYFRFEFVENIFVRILLVSFIIYLIQIDVFVGLIAFLAVFTLFLERNHALALKNF
jgi:multisubunit Na+/H+ antiporter MnhB subunit